ncbi:MAG TPA: PD-(D/E)XK nuclease family transposase [Candidatus Rifleibacterium sp.]|nr:PD-(D/E)XK nuclease family transposase [Candidatus Rifleibacterium sp.]
MKRSLRGIDMQRATYLNPFTDFGFKKLFGEEYNKDLLIDFLNQLLKKEQGSIFRKLFAAAEIAKFTPEEAMAHEDSLKVYRDLKNSLDTAREEGREEGIAQVAKNLLQMGQTIADVSKATGMSLEALDKLQASDSNSVKEPAAPCKTTKKPKDCQKNNSNLEW